MSHGYRLNDVSLCEERFISTLISHKIKTDYSLHLLGFVSNNDKHFQETLNSLEFSLKFQTTFNSPWEYNSFHSSDEGETEHVEGSYS